jgi:hypothetical protein
LSPKNPPLAKKKRSGEGGVTEGRKKDSKNYKDSEDSKTLDKIRSPTDTSLRMRSLNRTMLSNLCVCQSRMIEAMLIAWSRSRVSGTGSLATPYISLLRIRSDEDYSQGVDQHLS